MFFSLFLPPFSDRSGWNWFRPGLRQATFLTLVEHPKACGFSMAARSVQEKQQRRDTHSHRETLLQTHPVTQKVFTHNFTGRKLRTEPELLADVGCFSHSSKKSAYI